MGEGGLWRLWVDSGGTFTDCLAIAPDGRVHRAKVLSNSGLRARLAEVVAPRRLILEVPREVPPELLAGLEIRGLDGGARGRVVASRAAGDGGRQTVDVDRAAAAEWTPGEDLELHSNEEAPVLAARLVTRTARGRELPPMAVRLASTRGTNALLEGRGAPTALFVTRGHGDLLEIGNQQRPDLFALRVVKPPPLHREVVEVDERLAADGSVLAPVDLDGLAEPVATLLASGVRAAAVALLHAYRNPEHERQVGDRLRRLGFRHVSLSSELGRRIKILGRAQTAVVDAYLADALATYIAAVRDGLAPRSFHLMTSAGGLVAAADFRPKDSLLSGPAGGVLGAVAAGRRSGGRRLLAFDMGGTSTDVSRYDGVLEYRRETRVGAARLASTSVAVETVAAGGGSVCAFDGRQLKVGPRSAGASPGPACYGAGGPLTLTDVNLLLGRIDAGRFAFRVDLEAARAAAEGLFASVVAAGGERAPREIDQLLAGLLRIANEKMAAAVRRMAVRHGYDPGDYWLVAFGGAGPQHACAVADLLGIDTALVPADAALLSAAGLGSARIERFAARQVLADCAAVGPRLSELLAEVEAEARRQLLGEGSGVAAEGAVEVRLRRAHLRFAGQEATLAIDLPARLAPGTLRRAFRRRYRELFGYDPGRRPVEIESLEVLVASAAASPPRPRPADDAPPAAPPAPGARHRLHAAGRWRRAATLERAGLRAGDRRSGPALVLEPHSVTVVEPGWSVEVDSAAALLLHRSDA